tara:strand:+ start:230 stop:547 length:318 start_codon:yes stop_codon:yes gene_type:complete
VFKKLENKIKEIALRIYKSPDSNTKRFYEDLKKINELAVLHKYLYKLKKDSDWVLHEKKLNETLNDLNLHSQKLPKIFDNKSEITPLIDSIKDLVTEIPESNDDK